ncbi:MAG: AMP-binding protein [Legionella sp.]|uniref:AMP-binding protein n=1 Tax=Legionella sp. TaxID=459 RepID=UPI0039E3413C
MDLKNSLAQKLYYALLRAENHFSMDEDSVMLNSKKCFTKVTQYITWLNQMNVHSVMIIGKPSIDTLCLCYALVLSNKTYIPVHTSTSAELLKNYLQVYQVDLLVLQPQLLSQLDFELKTKLAKEQYNGFYYILCQREPMFCLMPGIIFFTSGTSAQPKGVYHNYETLQRYVKWCYNEFKLNDDDNFLFTMELSFVASLKPLFVPVLAGAKISFISRESSNKLQLIIDRLLQKKITVLNVTPTFLKTLLQHIEKKSLQHCLSSIRLIILGGEPIDSTLINYWFSHIRSDTFFYNLYGATEYFAPFYKKISAPLKERERLHLGQLRPGSEYKLLPAAEQNYELCVAGDIAIAYVDNQLTQENYIIIDDRRFIKTNDFVQQYHNELFYCSRAQRIIKRYGQLINLDQIEYSVKQSHSNLKFVAFADAENENKIYLIIHGTAYNEDLLAQIKHTLNAHLPGYMHPNEYCFADELPLTLSGKVDYVLVKKQWIKKQREDITQYFQRFFPNHKVDKEAKILDLNLESIDYIEMINELLKITGKWLDIAKINNNTRIATISSCLVDLNIAKSTFNEIIKLNPSQRRCYFTARGLLIDPEKYEAFHHYFYCLKGPIDIKKLKISIQQTIANHFMLSCKLKEIDGELFFVRTDLPFKIKVRNSLFFPKRMYEQLQITINSERLVKIYIQKKKKQYFLVIAFHHIALDGWSVMLLREEIFCRYEDNYKIPLLNKEEEVVSLNQIDDVWQQGGYNIQALKSLMPPAPPSPKILETLFNGPLEEQHTCISLSKKQVDVFAYGNEIGRYSYSTIFVLLFHQAISLLTGTNKLFFYTTFSNRNLPVAHIRQLLTNLVASVPISFDSTHLTTKEFALQIQQNLAVFFKNMGNGVFDELWEDKVMEELLLSLRKSCIIFTYINKVSGDEYIQDKYIDWDQTINKISYKKNQGMIFFRIYNMGSKFVVLVNTYMKKHTHAYLMSHFKKLIEHTSDQVKI